MNEITLLLHQIRQGDATAMDQIFDLIYPELKRLAASQRMVRSGQSLTPTVLVNETYLKLSQASQLDLVDRRHFMICAARTMRHIVIDDARAKKAQRRGGDQIRITLTLNESGNSSNNGSIDQTPDMISLDRALNELHEVDPELSQLVELKFFAGLTMTEIADLLDSSLRTVNRNWARARALLNLQLA